MKDKILFLTDLWFFNFGMAKFLQEKYDADFFVIYDLDDKARKFFKNQNIVKYEKIWFYLDCLKNLPKKPDINYLREFEKKYKLNLWTIAYYDRQFNQYNSFYKFSDNEILAILENECKFFEEILDQVKPNFVSLYFTISHYQELFRLMCLARGIKILMFSGSKIGKTMMISEKGLIMDNMDNSLINTQTQYKSLENNTFEEYIKQFTMYDVLRDYIHKQFEENFWRRYKPFLKFIFSKRDNSYNLRYTYYGRTRINILKNRLSNFFKKKYRNKFINSNFISKLSLNETFAYFPLHYEPERNLLIDAPFHCNQIEIIKNISRSLPVNFMLYVKEHPTQKVIGWRKISYYKQLQDLPNVRLIHPSVKPDAILEKCKLVITISGTAGLEAIFYKRPVIVFTDTFYSNIPSVYRIKKINDLPSVIKKALHNSSNNASIDNELSVFMNNVSNNIFVFDVTNIASDFS